MHLCSQKCAIILLDNKVSSWGIPAILVQNFFPVPSGLDNPYKAAYPVIISNPKFLGEFILRFERYARKTNLQQLTVQLDYLFAAGRKLCKYGRRFEKKFKTLEEIKLWLQSEIGIPKSVNIAYWFKALAVAVDRNEFTKEGMDKLVEYHWFIQKRK